MGITHDRNGVFYKSHFYSANCGIHCHQTDGPWKQLSVRIVMEVFVPKSGCGLVVLVHWSLRLRAA